MARRTPLVLAAVLIAVAVPDRGAVARDLTSMGVALLERWNSAVANHTPGKFDEAVEQVMAFSYEDRRQLDTPMRTFLLVVSGAPYEPDSALAKRIHLLGRGARERFGYEPFLERAVMLHTDAAIAGSRNPPQIVPALPPRVAGLSPLLATQRMTVNRDGEILGEIESNWNWPFARSLVGYLHLAARTNPFVGDWYHATAAYMFSRLEFAEVWEHLGSARTILPDDARILFDRGSYIDIQAMPMTQVLLRGVDLGALQQARTGRRLPRTASPATRKAVALDIPPKETALADAESLFRRALRADPAFAEARVRLARVLLERGRHEEALTEAVAALAGNPSEVVGFYGHLFAGRAAQAAGRYDDAARHFDGAAKLFPDAQSAMLARSQLALLRADVPGAAAALERLPADPQPEALEADPWTYYRYGIGRDWEPLYTALRIK